MCLGCRLLLDQEGVGRVSQTCYSIKGWLIPINHEKRHAPGQRTLLSYLPQGGWKGLTTVPNRTLA